MRNIKLLLGFLLFFIPYAFARGQVAETINAKIETENIEGVLELKAVAQNLGSVHQSLNYIFLAVKKDKANNMSSSQQQNKFTLSPKETKTLSRISLNMGKNEGLKVYLFIKDEKSQKVVAKDSLEMNAKNIKNAASYEKTTNEENMILSNVVINDTKSRIGDEFYTKLYALMMLNGLQFPFRIKIAEVPTTGKNTQLQVFANDENISSFIAKPDDEYLSDAANETLASLLEYNQQNQVSDKGFIY
ncbi:curli-like amyloid fiber formation chaperone CsgH [Chryseobacterium sp. R2A-55]|uniref:curli-like amyloid fiber formation chaperone CsgH n=1 Tax=Chryseobacterium sp. R2A-55 TaxID=2744445 RepID=UPI001F48F4F3|nr:curli-like amyloid fiber formation chaperone CsgH [Chryseobacterium sp. R2A-55]